MQPILPLQNMLDQLQSMVFTFALIAVVILLQLAFLRFMVCWVIRKFREDPATILWCAAIAGFATYLTS